MPHFIRNLHEFENNNILNIWIFFCPSPSTWGGRGLPTKGGCARGCGDLRLLKRDWVLLSLEGSLSPPPPPQGIPYPYPTPLLKPHPFPSPRTGWRITWNLSSHWMTDYLDYLGLPGIYLDYLGLPGIYLDYLAIVHETIGYCSWNNGFIVLRTMEEQ